MKRQSILAVVVVLFLMGTNSSKATLVGYVAEGKNIYRTDFETGQQMKLTLSLPFNTDRIEAMAVSPVDGSLYVVGHWAYQLSNTQRGLYKIDPITSDVSVVSILLGEYGGLGTFHNLSIAPDGTPYTMLNLNELYALPLNSEDSYNYIGQPTNTSFHTFAIDNEGTGIGWNDKNSLRWLDLENATTTLAGEPFGVGEHFDTFHYAPDGTLYAWGDKTLYEINIDSCTTTDLGTFTYGGLPFAIAPEPSTLLLLGIGTVMLRRKR